MMRKTTWIAILLVMAAVIAGVTLFSQNPGGAAGPIAMPGGASFRILLGVNDQDSTRWDGSVSVSPGSVAGIRGWKFADGDSTDNKSSWKASSRVAVGRKGVAGPMQENGVIVTV